MKTTWRTLLCSVLILCCLSSACIIGATNISEKSPTSNISLQSDSDISSRANFLALDASITKNGVAWAQLEDYIAYRIWIDNTTGALMTVTITSPSGQTKNLYVTSGNDLTYTNNNAEQGVYRVSFHTYADALSGTVRVRVSTTPL